MTTLEEKIKEAKSLKKETEQKEERISKLKTEMYEELETKYPLFIHRDERARNDFDSDNLEKEMQLLLRSMIKREVIIKIPGDESREEFNLTCKHGIKIPRCHGNHDFLPGHWKNDDIPTLKGRFYDARNEKIDFSVLEGNKEIHQDKFLKFIEFLIKIIQLWEIYKSTEKELLQQEKGFEKLRDLNEYSDLDILSEYIRLSPKIEEIYEAYEKEILSFKKTQSTLLQEIQDFNKPFKILLTLKGQKIDEF